MFVGVPSDVNQSRQNLTAVDDSIRQEAQQHGAQGVLPSVLTHVTGHNCLMRYALADTSSDISLMMSSSGVAPRSSPDRSLSAADLAAASRSPTTNM